MPTGFLVVREHGVRVYFEGKWRSSEGAQRKKRLGGAWLQQDPSGAWVKKAGRVKDGYLDERRAHIKLAGIIEADEEELLRSAPGNRELVFEDAAAAWLDHLQHERRVKPSTLREYRILLADPRVARKARAPKSKRGGRVMRAFGGERLCNISAQDIRRFLSTLDHEEMSAGTVNKHRQLLHALFEFAKSSDIFGLKENPVSSTERRPESGTAPLDVFEPKEVEMIARAAREGLHRKRSEHDYSVDTRAEQRRMDDQDGDLFVTAAFTGLRLGELLALQWHDLDLDGALLTVARAVSAGVEVDSTKSRQFRTVPLAEQAVEALKRLSKREHFTGRGDYVFCRADGGPLDRSTVRKRFMAAQDAAGVRRRRFHDLRHSFGSLAVRHFDAVQVQSLLGHSSLQTTERYLHTRPRTDDAAKLTRAFAGSSETATKPRANR